MYELLVFILKHIKTNMKSEDGKKILSTALKHHNSSYMRILIHNKAVKMSDIFCMASEHGCSDIVRLCIHQGVDVNILDAYKFSALYFASCYGHLETVKLLIEHGANVNSFDKWGTSPLYIASEQEYFEIVKLLVINGANVNTDGIYNKHSALLVAIDYSYTDIVQFLIENGADIDETNYDKEYANDYRFNGNNSNALEEHVEYITMYIKQIKDAGWL